MNLIGARIPGPRESSQSHEKCSDYPTMPLLQDVNEQLRIRLICSALKRNKTSMTSLSSTSSRPSREQSLSRSLKTYLELIQPCKWYNFNQWRMLTLLNCNRFSSGTFSVVAGQEVTFVNSTAGIKSSTDYYIEFYQVSPSSFNFIAVSQIWLYLVGIHNALDNEIFRH